jgi:hypothetical protein
MSTGTDQPVEAALELLSTVEERPLEEHLGVYTRAHELLQDALAGLDEG